MKDVATLLRNAWRNLTLNTFNITNTAMYSNRAGGFYKKGNVVFVNARLYVQGTFPANDYNTVTGNNAFPKPALQSALSVAFNPADSASGASAVINENGALVVQSGGKALTASTIYITGAYIASVGGVVSRLLSMLIPERGWAM